MMAMSLTPPQLPSPSDEIWVEHRPLLEAKKKAEPTVTLYCEQFSVLLGSGKHADVLFRVGDSVEEVPAHKAVLSARSEYFNAMFRQGDGAMSEGSQKVGGLLDLLECSR